MRHKLLDKSPKTYVLIFETGDELSSGLQRFATVERLSGSSFKAIGALSSVKLGWFNWQTKNYDTAVELNEQVELLSLIGDIAMKEGNPQIHAHVVVGKSDGTAHGGHLLKAVVRPTCELILTESPIHLQKQVDPESGLALIRLRD
jgi:predicted DNA-binding protein with PD1-like motif